MSICRVALERDAVRDPFLAEAVGELRPVAQAFALSEGISRQALERHAVDFDRSLAERAKKLEAEFATEARRRAGSRRKRSRKTIPIQLTSIDNSLLKNVQRCW